MTKAMETFLSELKGLKMLTIGNYQYFFDNVPEAGFWESYLTVEWITFVAMIIGGLGFVFFAEFVDKSKRAFNLGLALFAIYFLSAISAQVWQSFFVDKELNEMRSTVAFHLKSIDVKDVVGKEVEGGAKAFIKFYYEEARMFDLLKTKTLNDPTLSFREYKLIITCSPSFHLFGNRGVALVEHCIESNLGK